MYVAHKTSDGRIQTVEEHNLNVATIAKETLKGFEEMGNLAYNAGLYHDLGKCSPDFQNRILNGGGKVDHSSYGAYKLYESKKNLSSFSSMVASGHHTGLQDRDRWSERMRDASTSPLNITCTTPTMNVDAGKLYTEYKDYITRFVFASVTDADSLDTESFMTNAPLNKNPNTDMGVLLQKLDNYTSPWFPAKGNLNSTRCEIYKDCVEMGKTSPRGMFTLTVPTGGGKTVSSLAFALNHAKANGMSRIIYVVPYTSIIEQTAKVFREILGEEYVLEHHSGVEFKDKSDWEQLDYLKHRCMEDWRMPVIVTTSNQFFESLHHNKRSKTRKLVSIPNSVVIFDEAQMIPTPFLEPCVKSMVAIHKMAGCSIVLCTATQPSLNKYIENSLPKGENIVVKEICRKTLYNDPVFTRTSIQFVGDMETKDIVSQLNSMSQVLCIVNMKSTANEIYNGLSGNKGECYYLTTNLIPVHRREILETIRQRLKNNLPCKVISTSLIEAGVDVDFPCVYREMAGVDSILQSAGRCNREGKRSNNSPVYVFQLKNVKSVGGTFGADLKTRTGGTLEVISKFGSIVSEQAIKCYYDYIYSKKNLDKKDIESLTKDLKFQTIAEQFKLIDNNTVNILIPYNNEAITLISDLEKNCITKTNMRKLGKYSVSMYVNSTIPNTPLLRRVRDTDSYVLVDMNLYSNEFGLNTELLK